MPSWLDRALSDHNFDGGGLAEPEPVEA